MAIELALFALAAILAVPALFLSLQLMSSIGWKGGEGGEGKICRADIAIIVPAHDEADNLLATLEHIGSQIDRNEKIVVVADNCSDDTAAIAAGFGAAVLQREDRTRLGKGYALAFGIDHLRSEPPAFVAIVDADCTLTPGALEPLVQMATATGRPVQACYLMAAPPQATPAAEISAFAFLMKNKIRQLGMMRLGLPGQLLGSGMVFPWKAIEAAKLGSGEIVEDMKLAAEMVQAGLFPAYCPQSIVTSAFPSEEDAALVQRRRWEHGHLGIILSHVPALAASGLRNLDIRRLGFALDLMVPPLTLLLLFYLLLLTVFFLLGLAGYGFAGFIGLGVAFVGLAGALLLGWYRFGRDVLPFRSILRVPGYILWKLGIYSDFLGNREDRWVRTKRSPVKKSELKTRK